MDISAIGKLLARFSRAIMWCEIIWPQTSRIVDTAQSSPIINESYVKIATKHIEVWAK